MASSTILPPSVLVHHRGILYINVVNIPWYNTEGGSKLTQYSIYLHLYTYVMFVSNEERGVLKEIVGGSVSVNVLHPSC